MMLIDDASDPRARVLRFIYDQSYGKVVDEAPPSSFSCRVPGRRSGAVATNLEWGDVLEDRFAAGSFWQRLQRLIYEALGVTRWEPHNPYNPHRSYPSARSLFPVHTYLCLGEDAFHYDPVGHCLVPVARTERFRPPDDRAVLVLAGSPEFFPPTYGALRYPLTVLEGGHLLYNLVRLGEALELHPRAELIFFDEPLLRSLALPIDGRWIPMAAIALGAMSSAAPLPSSAREPMPPAAQLDASSVDRLGWISMDSELDDFHRRLGRASEPLATTRDGRALLSRGLAARNSGRSAGALCPRVGRVPHRAVSAAVEALAAPLPHHLQAARYGASPLRLLLISERVDGLEDGLHEVSIDSGRLDIRAPGKLLARVQDAFAYPPEQLNIRAANIVWFLVTDFFDRVTRMGPRGFRLTLLELGWRAQAISTALGAAGLFARPTRSYDEERLDALLSLGPSEMVAYQIISGVNNFTDLLFDLRPDLRPLNEGGRP